MLDRLIRLNRTETPEPRGHSDQVMQVVGFISRWHERPDRFYVDIDGYIDGCRLLKPWTG